MTRHIGRGAIGRLAPWLAALSFIVGCGHDLPPAEKMAERPVRYDLAANIGSAEVMVERREIPMGTPAARNSMESGFSLDEEQPKGNAPFVWGVGEASAIRLLLTQKRPISLKFRCVPYFYDGGPPQRMAVELNGRVVSMLALPRRESEQEVALPQPLLHAGVNRVVFRYAYAKRPAEVVADAKDRRMLAVSFRTIRVIGGRAGGTPLVDREDGGTPAILLPEATQLDYYLRLRRGDQLRIERLQSTGSGEPLIEVEAAFAGGRLVTKRMRPGDGDMIIPLAPGPPGPARISLRTVTGNARIVGAAVLGMEQAPAGQQAIGRARGLARPRHPNLLLYQVDALRADALGCYGDPKMTSPLLDRFSRRAVLHENAFAACSWTRPSTATVMTGLYPPGHGVNGTTDGIPATVETLPERLQKAGYRTAGIVTNSHLAGVFGFSRGFDIFRQLREKNDADIHHLSDEVVDRARGYFRKGSRPWFLFLHMTDPHAPYSAHEPYRTAFGEGDAKSVTHDELMTVRNRLAPAPPPFRDRATALYRAEIAFDDHSFGRILRDRASLSKDRGIVIAFLADHGESFGDRLQWEHSTSLYRDQIQVPFILKMPGKAAGLEAEPASQVDVVPTFLAAASVGERDDLPGRDLAIPAAESLEALSHLEWDRVLADSIVRGRWHLIVYKRHYLPWARVELFNLESDPAERRNIADRRPLLAGWLASRIRTAWSRGPAHKATTGELDEQMRERLHALGYLN